MNVRPVAVMDTILADLYRLPIYTCYASVVSAASATSQTASAADVRIGVGEALVGLTASVVRRSVAVTGHHPASDLKRNAT